MKRRAFFSTVMTLSIAACMLAGCGKTLTEEEAPGEEVALYFKNGDVMVGELLSKTEDEYTMMWKGRETVVFAGQVERVGSPREAMQEKAFVSDEEISKWWPYENDVVIRLTNGAVLDADITIAGEEKLTIVYSAEGGGHVEQDIERSRVEYLLFRPVENGESRKIEETLKGFFPGMRLYKTGNFTVVTDSDITWAREYRQTLRNTYTNIYLKFFDLLKGRAPQFQNFVVIFDDYSDFFDYAIADGVPGWAVAGYFHPDDKVLYLFNMLGDKFSTVLFEGLVGESGRTIDEITEQVADYVDPRRHIFIEGQLKVIKDKFWEAYSYYKGIFRRETMATLRHEFTHEIFSNYGLQGIILSQSKKDKDKMADKKKEFLETKDHKKKADLVKQLMAMRSKDNEVFDMRAANSWLVEGMATYCETQPPGGKNDRWLFLYQELAREGTVYPLESLAVYKIGSFPGVSAKGMLYSYAQSWAYVAFLMDRYPKEFMVYQEKMSGETARDFEDVTWLLASLGKDLKALDAEFQEYMAQFEELEDPFLLWLDKIYGIFKYYY